MERTALWVSADCSPTCSSRWQDENKPPRVADITAGNESERGDHDRIPSLRDASWHLQKTHHDTDGTGLWEHDPVYREPESSISPPDHSPPSLPDIGDPPTPTPHIKELSYSIGRQPLNESGRWRGRGLGLEGGGGSEWRAWFLIHEIPD